MAQWINEQGEYYNGKTVTYNDMTYISPTEEILTAAGYHIVVEPELTDEQLLAQARQLKIDQINDYDQSEDVNEFFLAGNPMWLDAQTRQTLRISIESYNAMGMQSVTKWFNGNEYTFPTSAWIDMLNALEVYAAEALNTTEAHKAYVNILTNIEEIEEFDIEQGYPEKLNFNTEWLHLRSQQ